ncbi:MAG: DsbE family thiol:disulfide interchange protein [Rhodospirillales bacterium]|nr:DsbE family thiol:disulfide interchange protein [Rhodospirillales bacterium]MDP6805762.1 DsbE family thiol:disulfide interchange protein [Rhodospirillales bacterium]
MERLVNLLFAGRFVYVLPLAALAALTVVFLFGLQKDPRIVPSALIDKPVPEFALPPITGGPGMGLASADLKSRISVVNVWASWCGPCKAEHPLVEELARSGLATVYGLNYKDEPSDALRWLADLGNPYTEIGADRNGRVGIDWGVYGVPETFIVDHEGRIRHKHVGPMTAEAVDGEIEPILRVLGP